MSALRLCLIMSIGFWLAMFWFNSNMNMIIICWFLMIGFLVAAILLLLAKKADEINKNLVYLRKSSNEHDRDKQMQNRDI